jgi:hypothetical protein
MPEERSHPHEYTDKKEEPKHYIPLATIIIYKKIHKQH